MYTRVELMSISLRSVEIWLCVVVVAPMTAETSPRELRATEALSYERGQAREQEQVGRMQDEG
jgi:hypothetical protein